MIAARYQPGVGLDIGEAPVPEIGDDELLVRVAATSICGTDLKIVRYGHRKLQPEQSIILGHEFVGTIARAGRRVADYAVGTYVGIAPNIGCGHCELCRRGLMNMCPDYSAFGIDRDGSHAEFVRIPAAAIAQGNVIPISPGVPPTEAALTEPLSCAVNGMRAVQLKAGESVLIYGAGPMGLLNLLLARAIGAARAWVVDLNDARLEKAKAMGADGIFNPSRGPVKDWVAGLTQGRGPDVIVTAVPVRQVMQEAVGLLAPFGRLCLFAGLPKGESLAEFDANLIHYRNLLITGVTGGPPQDYRAALRLIESRQVDARQIISHVFPLRDARRAYETATSGEGLKIVMTTPEA